MHYRDLSTSITSRLFTIKDALRFHEEAQMRIRFLLLGLPMVGALACASEPKVPEPEYVRVSVVSATVGPAKIDGSRWDTLSVVPNLVANAAIEGGTSTRGAVAAAFVASEALAPFEKPDPRGWAELGTERRMLARTDDTLTPTWSDSATFSRVRLSDATRLRIHLEDSDPGGAEPIGDVELHGGHLQAALQRGSVEQIKVDGQTHGQVLFVGISVAPDDQPR
jgi:hypothetical protein